MNKEMEWNTEVTKIHHTNYVRNSRAIAVAWFVFCACYTILNIVVFIQPFWFGDTNESPGVGYFGTYEWCERVQGSDYRCRGDFLDFNTIRNDYFRATSFLVGAAALLFIFSIICMLLFLFLKGAVVLRICGTLQLIAAVFMAIACIIYPNAFDDDNVRRICGQEATAYNMDKCQIRWGYILAIVLIFDALILSVLAFVLAARQAKSIPEMKEEKAAGSFDNNGFAGEFVNVVPSTRVKSAYRPRNIPPPQPATQPRPNLASFGRSTDASVKSLTSMPMYATAQPSKVVDDDEEPLYSQPNKARADPDSPRDTDAPSSSMSIPSPRSDSQEDEFAVIAQLDGVDSSSSRGSTPVRSRSNRSRSSTASDKSDSSNIRF